MRPALLFLLALILSFESDAGAGNGSSGVGNAYDISEGLATMMPENSIRVQDDKIYDGKSNESLVKIEKLPAKELKRFRHGLIEANLGTVKGYEFVPERGNKTQKGFWVICKQEECVKLTPLSDRNLKVPALIGSLTRPE